MKSLNRIMNSRKILLFFTSLLLIMNGCYDEEPELEYNGNNPAQYEFMGTYTTIDYDSRKGYDFLTKIYDKNIDIHFPRVDSNLVNEQFEIDIMPVSNMTLADVNQEFRLLRAVLLKPYNHYFFGQVTVVFQVPATLDVKKIYAFAFGNDGESVNYVPILKIEADGDNYLVTVSSGKLCGIGIAEVQNPSFESYSNILSGKDYLSLITEKIHHLGTLTEIQAAEGLTGGVADEVNKKFSEWGEKIFSSDTSFKSAQDDDPYETYRANAKSLAEWLENYQMLGGDDHENTDIYKETMKFMQEEFDQITASLDQKCCATNDNCEKARLLIKMLKALAINQLFGVNSELNEFCNNSLDILVNKLKFSSGYLAVHYKNSINPGLVAYNWKGEIIKPNPKITWKMYEENIVSFDTSGNMKGEQLGSDYVAACWCDDITVSDTILVNVGKWYQGSIQIYLLIGDIDLERAKFSITVYFRGKPGLDELQADWIFATLIIEDYHDFVWTQRTGYPVTRVFKQNSTLTQPFFSFFTCKLNNNGTINISWYDTDNKTLLVEKNGNWLDWLPLNDYPDFLWACYNDPASCGY